jgi:hypothetical protein
VPVPLPDELLDLLRQPSLCFVATIMPDSSPQLTQTWVSTDGEHILIKSSTRDIRVGSQQVPHVGHARPQMEFHFNAGAGQAPRLVTSHDRYCRCKGSASALTHDCDTVPADAQLGGVLIEPPESGIGIVHLRGIVREPGGSPPKA